jgi:hypothetical protein
MKNHYLKTVVEIYVKKILLVLIIDNKYLFMYKTIDNY